MYNRFLQIHWLSSFNTHNPWLLSHGDINMVYAVASLCFVSHVIKYYMLYGRNRVNQVHTAELWAIMINYQIRQKFDTPLIHFFFSNLVLLFFFMLGEYGADVSTKGS